MFVAMAKLTVQATAYPGLPAHFKDDALPLGGHNRPVVLQVVLLGALSERRHISVDRRRMH